MGLGIGGDYPLSAIISSEFAATKIRGRMMSAVFAAQGFGSFSEWNELYALVQSLILPHGQLPPFSP